MYASIFENAKIVKLNRLSTMPLDSVALTTKGKKEKINLCKLI